MTFWHRAAHYTSVIATAEKYPTRTSEHVFAWAILVWSCSVLVPGDMLLGPQYAPMLALAPEPVWGAFGAAISVMRIISLICNGHWEPSAKLRTVGSLFGMIFFWALAYCYHVAIAAGAPDFPFRRVLYVFIFAEAYSVLRGSQDIMGQRLVFQARRASNLASRSGNAAPC